MQENGEEADQIREDSKLKISAQVVSEPLFICILTEAAQVSIRSLGWGRLVFIGIWSPSHKRYLEEMHRGELQWEASCPWPGHQEEAYS